MAASPQNQPQVIFLQNPSQNVSTFKGNEDGVESRKKLLFPKRHLACGIIFVIFSVVLVIIGTLRLMSYSHYPDILLTGVGIWTGLAVFIPGLLSILAFTNNSRKLLTSSLITELIALIIMAVSVLFCYIEFQSTIVSWQNDQNFRGFIKAILITNCIVSVNLIIHLVFGFQEFCHCCSRRKLPAHVPSPVQTVNSTLRKPKVHFVCGIIFVISALQLIIPEIIRVAYYSHYQYFSLSGVGIWAGLFILIPGILSILAFKLRSRKWLTSVLIMESIALLIMAIAAFVCIGEAVQNHSTISDQRMHSPSDNNNVMKISSLKYNNDAVRIQSARWHDTYNFDNYNFNESDLDFIIRFTYVIIGTICIVAITLIFHIAFCCYELCFCCSRQNLPGHVAGPVQYVVVNSTGTEPTQPDQAALNTTVHQVTLMPGQTSFSILIVVPNSGQSSMKEAEAIGATSAAEPSNTITVVDLPPDYDDAMTNPKGNPSDMEE